MYVGVRGAYSSWFTIGVMRKRKYRDLGWAWKPDSHLDRAATRWINRTKRKRKKDKKDRKRTKHERLLYADGAIFYESRPWKALRIKVLVAYGRRCMKCSRVDGEMHVDHIKPRSRFPLLSLTFENLQVLCKDCNMEKSNLHATDYRDESVSRALDEQLIESARERI